jgi:hypothetical protein
MTRWVARALALALIVPATASAAARFASQTGSPSTDCIQTAPCDILTAVNSAHAGDDITIEPGAYHTGGTSLDDNGLKLDIHGQPGQPRPVITSTAGYAAELSGGSTLSDVELDDTANASYGFYAGGPNATIDHVLVHASGSGGWACYPNATLIDSVCWDSGTNGTAVTELVVSSVTGELHNDTLIATGTGGDAIGLYGEGTATMTINMTNTIAYGAGTDVYAHAVAGSSAILTADHSNYSTIDNADGGGTITITPPGSGANQTTLPALTDDYHELASSPTVDAGADSALDGTTDLDGNPRQLGVHTDIGAYEFVPAPTCQAVSAAAAFQTATQIQLSCKDLAGATISYFYSQHPAHGTISIDPATGVATYTPADGYSGTDTFTYHGQSNHGESAVATVSITVGKAPVVKTPAPAISHFKRKGKTFSFTLSEDAKITLTIKRKGHKPHKISGRLSAGKDKVKLSKKLKPGKYTVTLSATDAGGASKTAKLRFKIKA